MVCGTPYLNLIVWGGGVATAAGVRRARKPRIFPHATRPPQAASTPILKNLDNIRTVSDPRQSQDVKMVQTAFFFPRHPTSTSRPHPHLDKARWFFCVAKFENPMVLLSESLTLTADTALLPVFFDLPGRTHWRLL